MGTFIIPTETLGDVHVIDVKPDNVILDIETGDIIPIDVHFYFNDHEERLEALVALGIHPDPSAPSSGAQLQASRGRSTIPIKQFSISRRFPLISRRRTPTKIDSRSTDSGPNSSRAMDIASGFRIPGVDEKEVRPRARIALADAAANSIRV
jgi:hypothetical protein